MNDQNIGANSELEVINYKRAHKTKGKRYWIFNPLTICLAILFVALCSVTLFTLQAKALKVNIIPRPDSLEIYGGLFTYELGERFLMLPGNYSIRAQAEGYKELEMQITISEEPNQTIDVVMQKLPGFLIANSVPASNINVYVDQIYKGETPLKVEVDPGLHDISFQSERYLPYKSEIHIEGRNIEQIITAELSPAWAEIKISSNPLSADIIVDNEILGQTPSEIELLQGKHTIQIKKAGFKLWQSDITASAGSTVSLDQIDLIKSDGKLSVITTPAGANITVNGQYQGPSPLSTALIPDRSYEILLSKAGFSPIKQSIDVKPGEEISLNINLIPVTGIVRLEIEPRNATVLLDGQLLNSTSRLLNLPATKHTLEVLKPGYATHKMVIIPKPGLTKQVSVQLQTEAQAKIAAIPSLITAMDNVTANLIIPDKFKMGASRREPGRRSNEIEKEVRLDRPFYLGTNEITNLAFKEFDPSHNSGELGRALLSDDDRPVVNITWEQGILFCNWLSERNDLVVAYEQVENIWRLKEPVNTGFRLPTEAEWAWAARYQEGTDPTRFPWGDHMPPTSNAGNYADESSANMAAYYISGYNDTYRGTAPVGSFPANNFGIQDLNGNVSEWVNDIYATSLKRGLLIDPIGPKTGDYYVIRGANFTSGRFSELRWTYRDYGKTGRPDVGFRIARYVE